MKYITNHLVTLGNGNTVNVINLELLEFQIGLIKVLLFFGNFGGNMARNL